MTTPSYNWRAQREKKAFLALADGSVFRAWSFGAATDALGEVVFNTGMSGYQEILTDPSYSGQLVTMTYPEIGNSGVNPADVEAKHVYANGFLVHNLNDPSNFRSTIPLADYLQGANVPALAGLDTRALTTKLRTVGTLKGFLCATGKLAPAEGVRRAQAWAGLDGQDYAALVSTGQPYVWDPDDRLTTSWGAMDQACGVPLAELPKPDLHIVAYDFGVKWNILRRLRQQGMKITVVPAKTAAAEVLALKPDGLFLSNGPADPAAVTYAAANIRALIGKLPIMGICLGHQLIGLALGGKTYRLKFGHHGCNHPVMDLATGKVEITSQNHNFAVDPETLDKGKVEVTHLNLNDRTVEGLRHRTEPLFCVQYHPEAAPGPHDSSYLFARFRDLIRHA
ncbi:MAG: glutamine-hydrolyzing carbamoyl-phosphate synthase small subunit [Lentisphaeria bacterium]|jgi:carbamoyl-phosphate synthase small subunit